MKTSWSLLFGLTFMVYANIASAQSFHNKGAIISITPNTIFSATDSVVNNGTITNNGQMIMGGVWLNLGTYNSGSGEIAFDSPVSSTPQIISHNSQEFNKLTISGGGQKLILGDITIVGNLNLEDGVIANLSNFKVKLNEGATVTGGSDASHIVGIIEANGKGDWLFPIGNGTTYLPVQVSGITDATTKATLRVRELSSGENLTGDKDIDKLSSKRYWEITVQSGTLANTSITLPLRGETSLPSDASSLTIAGSNEAFKSYTPFKQTAFTGDTNNGSITASLLTPFTFLTVASVGGEKQIIVYNALSPNGDGLNDYFRLTNIESFPNNKVTILNRWGDVVFEMNGYDNDQRSFKGENNKSSQEKLTPGIYFYKINPGNGSPEITGYLTMK